MPDEPQACVNTDRELWRGPEDQNGMVSERIFVTEGGGIGMSLNGMCIVMPIKHWHELAYKHSALSGNVNPQ